MGLFSWLKSAASRLADAGRAAAGTSGKRSPIGRTTSVALGAAAAASLTSAAVSTAAEAQTAARRTAPRRPPYASPTDTVRRYGEKFLLSARDSVVIKADTTWYPRTPAAGGALGVAGTNAGVGVPATPSPRPETRPRSSGSGSTASPGRASGGSYGGYYGGAPRASGGGHYSHYSHRSHSSHRSHRSGGWV